MGAAPGRAAADVLIQPLMRMVDAWRFPEETRLCHALALRIPGAYPRKGASSPVPAPISHELDPRFRCRVRAVRLPSHAQCDLCRATLLQLAAAAGAPPVSILLVFAVMHGARKPGSHG